MRRRHESASIGGRTQRFTHRRKRLAKNSDLHVHTRPSPNTAPSRRPTSSARDPNVVAASLGQSEPPPFWTVVSRCTRALCLASTRRDTRGARRSTAATAGLRLPRFACAPARIPGRPRGGQCALAPHRRPTLSGHGAILRASLEPTNRRPQPAASGLWDRWTQPRGRCLPRPRNHPTACGASAFHVAARKQQGSRRAARATPHTLSSPRRSLALVRGHGK